MYLAIPSWFRLNCLRTGVVIFCSSIHRWVMAHTAAYECGAREKTAEHLITFCVNFDHQSRELNMELVNEETMAWLNNNCPNIWRVFPKVIFTPCAEKEQFLFFFKVYNFLSQKSHETNPQGGHKVFSGVHEQEHWMNTFYLVFNSLLGKYSKQVLKVSEKRPQTINS